jgi:hypothetical protein
VRAARQAVDEEVTIEPAVDLHVADWGIEESGPHRKSPEIDLISPNFGFYDT